MEVLGLAKALRMTPEKIKAGLKGNPVERAEGENTIFRTVFPPSLDGQGIPISSIIFLVVLGVLSLVVMIFSIIKLINNYHRIDTGRLALLLLGLLFFPFITGIIILLVYPMHPRPITPMHLNSSAPMRRSHHATVHHAAPRAKQYS